MANNAIARLLWERIRPSPAIGLFYSTARLDKGKANRGSFHRGGYSKRYYYEKLHYQYYCLTVPGFARCFRNTNNRKPSICLILPSFIRCIVLKQCPISRKFVQSPKFEPWYLRKMRSCTNIAAMLPHWTSIEAVGKHRYAAYEFR